MRLWNRVLSEKEILEGWNTPACKPPKGTEPNKRSTLSDGLVFEQIFNDEDDEGSDIPLINNFEDNKS